MTHKPHSWWHLFGHTLIRFTLTAYASGQPKLTVRFATGEVEELTIEVPGFDLRSYDADTGFDRLHLVFRTPCRATLLSAAKVVNLAHHTFSLASTGEDVLQLVWIATPAWWTQQVGGELVS